MLIKPSSYDPHCPHLLIRILHAHSHFLHSSKHCTSIQQAPLPTGADAQMNDMVPAWEFLVQWTSPCGVTCAMAEEAQGE